MAKPAIAVALDVAVVALVFLLAAAAAYSPVASLVVTGAAPAVGWREGDTPPPADLCGCSLGLGFLATPRGALVGILCAAAGALAGVASSPPIGDPEIHGGRGHFPSVAKLLLLTAV